MRAFVLRLGSTAPLRLNKYTDNNKPRTIQEYRPYRAPLRLPYRCIILMRLPCFIYEYLGKDIYSMTTYRYKKREDP